MIVPITRRKCVHSDHLLRLVHCCYSWQENVWRNRCGHHPEIFMYWFSQIRNQNPLVDNQNDIYIFSPWVVMTSCNVCMVGMDKFSPTKTTCILQRCRLWCRMYQVEDIMRWRFKRPVTKNSMKVDDEVFLRGWENPTLQIWPQVIDPS